jgi:photosystem II stability/assembly factor-like uncharacterized protein
MKQKYFLFLIIFFALSFFNYCKAQTTLEVQSEAVVYSNSFEAPQDTVGLQRYGWIDFNSDVPNDGGTQSLFVSGGCIWPHAQIEIGPFENDGFYKIKCWGKNLQIGGSVSIDVEGDFLNGAIIIVNEDAWTYYESTSLFCPAGKKIVLSMNSGGIVQSAMLVDNLEIVNLKSIQSQWVIRNGGTTERLNDVVMLDSSTAIIVGDEGSILKTENAGITWKNTAPQIDCTSGPICIMKLNSVAFYDNLNGIVAGESVLLITSDGGENWQFLNSPSDNNFLSIGKNGLGDIYIGDDSGNIYNSRDTGKTWTTEHVADLPINSIFPFNGPIVEGVPILYALTTYSLYVKSFSSNSWEEWGPLGYFYGLGGGAFKGGFSEDGTAFIVGVEGDFVALSTIIRLRLFDSHWYSVGPTNEFGELYGLSIPSSNIIYTCGVNGKILKSVNSGDSWFSLKVPTSQALHAINFFDNERGFGVGDSGIILYTENGGTSSTNFPPSAFHLLEPVNEDSLSVARSITFKWQEAVDPDNDPVNYTLLISADSGTTWTSFGPVTDTTSLQIQNPVLIPGRYFWTVIANDGMHATPSLDVFAFTIYSVAEVDESGNNPNTFSLFQNYPNPFNPTTSIEYRVGSSEYVTLKVYDVLGREVATLVNEEKLPGEYEIEFDGSQLSSGIYFYKLTSGNFIETKKMIYLK